MVNQTSSKGAAVHDVDFEEFAASLFRLTRTIRSTAGLWVQLPGGLKRSDLGVLNLLSEHGECRPGFIARKLAVGPSVISRQLGALDKAELVVRRRDPGDGRAELIALTDAGRERLKAMRAAYIAGMQSHFTDWDDEKAYAATTLLHEISDHIAPALGRDSGRSDEGNEQEDV